MAQPIVRAHPMAGPCNGLTRGRAASRSPDAADLPPTLVVFSKCGVGKDLDLGMIWGPKPRNFFSAVPVHKEQLWDWAFMRLNCASCLASYLKCPSTPSRNIPSCDCLLIRFPLVLPLCWAGEQWLDWKSSLGPRTNVLATSSVPKFLLVSRIGSLKFNSKVMKKKCSKS